MLECARSRGEEAETGGCGGGGKREKGEGGERERAGTPDEPPEKRRWEYWSGMPATACLERSLLLCLLFCTLSVSPSFPLPISIPLWPSLCMLAAILRLSFHHISPRFLPRCYAPLLLLALSSFPRVFGKPPSTHHGTLTKPRITRLHLRSSSISDLRSSFVPLRVSRHPRPFENIKTTPSDCLLSRDAPAPLDRRRRRDASLPLDRRSFNSSQRLRDHRFRGRRTRDHFGTRFRSIRRWNSPRRTRKLNRKLKGGP